MGSNAMAEAMKQAKSEDGQQGQQQGEQQQGTPGAMDVLKSAAPSPFDLLRGVLRKK
jgi:hypothetical protein